MSDDGDGSYRDLKVWHKAMELTDAITSGFPSDERFALTSQLRRAAVSVPSCIAEGCGRGSKADYIRFLWMANGSLKEVETQLIIAGRQSYITKNEAGPSWGLLQEVGKMLRSLIRSLK